MQGTIGEVRLFGGTYAPKHWAFCQGQIIAIQGHDALYSLLGTTYGGDGRTTFGLPDLRGRLAVGSGTGPGLTPRPLGQRAGSEEVTLTVDHLPHHNHQLAATTDNANTHLPYDTILAAPQDTDTSDPLEIVYYLPDDAGDETILEFKNDAISTEGGGGDHENRQPFVVVNYIICMEGLYPEFT